jgi:hypothetical protein
LLLSRSRRGKFSGMTGFKSTTCAIERRRKVALAQCPSHPDMRATVSLRCDRRCKVSSRMRSETPMLGTLVHTSRRTQRSSMAAVDRLASCTSGG